MAYPGLPALPPVGVGGAGPGAFTRDDFISSTMPGQPEFVGAIGDIWTIDIRGTMPGGVNTSTSLSYRQEIDFAPGVDPAIELARVVVIDENVGFHEYLQLCSSDFEVVCLVIRNTSNPDDFTRVVLIENRVGRTGVDLWMAQGCQRVNFMPANGVRDEQRTIYLPGISETVVSDGILIEPFYTLIKAAILKLKFAREDPLDDGSTLLFRWMFGQVNTVWEEAEGIYPTIYLSRLASRNPTVC